MEAFAVSIVVGVVGCKVIMSARIGLTVTGFISLVVRLSIVSL